MQDEFEPTIVIEPSSANDATVSLRNVREAPSQSHLAVDSPGAQKHLTRRFAEATRKLLQRRLMIAAITTLGFLILIKTLALLFEGTTIGDVMVHSFSVLGIIGSIVYLRRNTSAPMYALRFIEAVIFGLSFIELQLIQVFDTEKLIAAGRMDEVPTLFATIGALISLFIAIYGIFIPANWKRTALMTGLAAVVSVVVVLVHAQWNPLLQQIDVPGFATPALTLMMAIVATVGAQVVHNVRREAESAKQYGQYNLTEEIGRGGMGVVYKAEHRMLKRPAAIKLIRPEAAFDESSIEGFEREVQLSATLSHWNTVQIYDYGRTEAGDFYYVMEYLEGESLRQRLSRSGPLSMRDTVAILVQVCDGLGEAHAKGMVHRDLKPANILLAEIGGQRDIAKILDFGLAINVSQTATQEVGISGSPPYMSPEQVRGEAVDARSDIYALGCLIYECLTGNALFNGSSLTEVLNAHLGASPSLDRLPESAVALKPLIERCIDPDRSSRMSDVAQLRNQLMQS